VSQAPPQLDGLVAAVRRDRSDVRVLRAMPRVARPLVRLAVALVAAGALLAGVLAAVSYSVDRLVHGAASAKEVPLGNLVATPAIPSVIYSADGSVLATLRSAQNRQPVPLKGISPLLITAVLDTEDHGFWVHGGVDLESIVRAALADIEAGGAVEGGSTIAQQLVKNYYLSDEKTIIRKLREAVLAERLEQRYSKAKVLDAYLNSVYLGSGAYGVQAASEEYFGKSAAQLNLPEAALLAGLIQAPSAYDPIYNPSAARERRSEVLARMVYYKSITRPEAAAANRAPLPTKVHDAPGAPYTNYGYYVDEVVSQLLGSPALGSTVAQREHALFSGGLRIFTNEVPSLQSYAQKVAVADIPPALHGVIAAFAVIDPRNGNVEALVGGPNPRGSYFDAATQGQRQPGSGFKLFTLIGALEEGYDVYDSILAASPCAVRFPGVPPQYGYNLSHPLHNDPGDPNGVVTLVQATALSINCAYLRLGYVVGLPEVIRVARSMGVSDQTLSASNPSLVIGTEAVEPIEMAAAYATVADGGIYHTPCFINRVVGPGGQLIYNGELPGRRVFSDQVADEAIVALQAVVQYGTGTAAALPGVDVAGKTGTTSNSVDAWFNGITPTLVSSVWIGNPAGEVPMYVGGQEVFGASYPTQIWHDVMEYALRGVPYSQFPAPDPTLMPPVEYIDTPGLQRDDLISHGEPPLPPTTIVTTTTTTVPTGPVLGRTRVAGAYPAAVPVGPGRSASTTPTATTLHGPLPPRRGP
jgi:penicillin-binding protein 1A